MEYRIISSFEKHSSQAYKVHGGAFSLEKLSEVSPINDLRHDGSCAHVGLPRKRATDAS
jgi:hypothetical protein